MITSIVRLMLTKTLSSLPTYDLIKTINFQHIYKPGLVEIWECTAQPATNRLLKNIHLNQPQLEPTI